MSLPESGYVVCRWNAPPTPRWSIVGIFATEEEARAACRDEWAHYIRLPFGRIIGGYAEQNYPPPEAVVYPVPPSPDNEDLWAELQRRLQAAIEEERALGYGPDPELEVPA